MPTILSMSTFYQPYIVHALEMIILSWLQMQRLNIDASAAYYIHHALTSLNKLSMKLDKGHDTVFDKKRN